MWGATCVLSTWSCPMVPFRAPLTRPCNYGPFLARCSAPHTPAPHTPLPTWLRLLFLNNHECNPPPPIAAYIALTLL